MKKGVIRPLAICILRKDGRIFAAQWFDKVKNEVFYRPLGGGIEFGEMGSEAAAREVREETGFPVKGLKYLGTLENVFTYEGEQGHEIVLVYEGEFEDPALYQCESITCSEEGADSFDAVWKPIEDFRRGDLILYPEGLIELLDNEEIRN